MTPVRVGLTPTSGISTFASSASSAASIKKAADERSAGTRTGQACGLCRPAITTFPCDDTTSTPMERNIRSV